MRLNRYHVFFNTKYPSLHVFNNLYNIDISRNFYYEWWMKTIGKETRTKSTKYLPLEMEINFCPVKFPSKHLSKFDGKQKPVQKGDRARFLRLHWMCFEAHKRRYYYSGEGGRDHVFLNEMVTQKQMRACRVKYKIWSV